MDRQSTHEEVPISLKQDLNYENEEYHFLALAWSAM